MRIFVILFFLAISHLYAQSNDIQQMLINSEWRVSKKWIGADTVTLERDTFPEFKGLGETAERDVLDNYLRYERIYFDGAGELKDHHIYIFCPVGEDQVKLVHFKIKKEKVWMKIKRTNWGSQSSVITTYIYKITNLNNDKIQLLR